MQSRPDEQATVTVEQRNQLRHWMRQVRCDRAHDAGAFDGGLPGYVHLSGGQVAQATVHEFAGPTTGAVRQVLGLGEHD